MTRVLIEDLGDMTDYVVFEETDLNTAAQDEPSVSFMSIKDIESTAIEFFTGKRVTVDVAGTAIWAGYIAHANRRFWFPVDDPNHLQRKIVLSLVDVATLFNRRIIFKQSDPAHVQGPVYTAQTYDDEVLDDLFAGWIDLSTDDLDLSSRVDQVGIVNPSGGSCAGGFKFYPFNGGETWGDAMRTIAQLPAAVFALVPGNPLGTSPFARLVYADVDEEDAPFELSDNPTASGVGYRECTIWDDGTDLVNDTLAWGAGKGANHMVFDRREDQDSIDEHGLWQSGNLIFNIWCQDTINRVTDRIINGSPGSRRGQKDDVRSVELVVDEPGLVVGQRVRFINEQYSVDQVLPIRKMNISFPTTAPRYSLLLSHEIDRWGFQDPPPPYKGYGDGGTIPPIEEESGECEDCGITDSFDLRTVDAAWGVSDSGIQWRTNYTTPGGVYVSGGQGHFFKGVASGSRPHAFTGIRELEHSDETEIYFEFSVDDNSPYTFPGGKTGSFTRQLIVELTQSADQSNLTQLLCILRLDATTPPVWNGVLALWRYNNDSTTPSDFEYNEIEYGWASGTTYKVRVLADREHSYARIWAGDTEPSVWTIVSNVLFDDGINSPSALTSTNEHPFSSPTEQRIQLVYAPDGFQSSPFENIVGPGTCSIDNLSIWLDGVLQSRCNVGNRFDNFNRNTFPGPAWGHSDYGYDWTVYRAASENVYVFNPVGSLQGNLSAAYILDSGPWSGAFTLTSRFLISADGVLKFRVDDSGVSSPPFENYSLGLDLTLHNSTGTGNKIALYGSDTVEVALPDDFTDWSETYYRVKWQVDADGSMRAKIWHELPGEPVDWMIERAHDPSDDDRLGNAFHVVWDGRAVGGSEFTPDWIDFEYDGKPCYYSSTAIDRFDRSISAHNWSGNDNYDVATWETPTRGTPDWVGQGFYFGDTAESPPLYGFGITSGEGRMNLTTPIKAGAFPFIAVTIQQINELQLPEVDFDHCRIEFDVRFTDATVAPASGGIARTTVNIGLAKRNSSTSYGGVNLIELIRSRTSSTDTRTRQLIVEGQTTVLETGSSVAAGLTDSHVIIDRDVDRGTVQMTLSGYSMVEESFDTLDPDCIYLLIQTETVKTSSSFLSTLAIDNIINNRTEVVAGSGGAAAVLAGQVHCQNATRQSATLYTTTYGIQTDSLEVFRDGALQRAGTDFTEGPGANEFEFSESIDEDDLVRVCYLPV